jgi:ribonuclease P protein component
MLVVRALPPAADATSTELGDDLDAGIRGVLRKQAAGGTRRG